MPKELLSYRCLLVSPSDVHAERDALTAMVTRWNAHIGESLGVSIVLVRWEFHSTPDMSDTAQAVINRQIVDDCDLGIAIFWSRLGTPTKEFPSGSVEEVYRLIQKGTRVMVYFCSRDIPQNALVSDQYARLLDVRKRFEQEGFLATYSDVDDLVQQVQLHLTSVIAAMAATNRGMLPFASASGTLTAPTPDVRVVAAYALLPVRSGRLAQPALAITVQNYSLVTVYLHNVYIEMSDGRQGVTLIDMLGQRMERRPLSPGDSFTYYYKWEKVLSGESVEDFACAAASDAIGRVYRSPRDDFRKLIASVFDASDGPTTTRRES